MRTTSQQLSILHASIPPAVRRTLAAVILIVTLAGATAQAGDVASSKTWITAAAEVDYPPFSMMTADGQAAGFAVELMRAALAAMGRETRFRTGPWQDVRDLLERGEIDALPLVGRTPEREALFDFTVPYMSLHGAIVVRKGNSEIRGLDDLRGKQVAVMKGDNIQEYLLRKARGIDLHAFDTFDSALKALAAGDHDAVVIQRLVARRLIQESGLANLEVLSNPIEGFRQDFCFAVREGDRETLALLNEGLAIVMADGTYRHLHAKWFAALQLPASRRIVIGGDHNFPPFEYRDENGRPAGLNVDLTRAIAAAAGLDIDIRLGPWSQVMQDLENGEIDALQGMFYSTVRGLKFDFTQPHMMVHYVGVVRRNAGPPPDTIEALAGRRVAVQQGDIAHDYVIKNGRRILTISAVDAQEDALRGVSAGEYDVALVSRLTALFLIKKHGWTDLVVGHKPLLSPEYCYAARQSQRALLSQLGEGLRILEASGEFRAIQEKWMGVYQEAPPTLLNALRTLALALAPFAAIFMLVVFWSWTLRRQVARQTRQLRESREKYRLLADNTLDVIWTMDLDFAFTYVNPAIERLTGYGPEEWVGSRWSDHCDEAPFSKMASVVAQEVAKGADHQGIVFETEFRRRDGSTLPVEIHAKVVFDAAAAPIMLQGVTRDITERRNAEDALRQSEHRLRTLVDTIPDLVWLKSRSGVYLSCNQTFARFFGARQSDIVGKTDYDFVDQDLADFFRGHDRKAMAADRPCLNEETLTFAEDGYQGLFETLKTPMHDANGELIGVLGIARDISDRKQAEKEKLQLEKQVQQAQKMESVGRLAGGVAHDFNNVLSVIIGYAELAMESTRPGEPLHGDLEQIVQAAKRSRDITRQLLAFARQDTIVPEVLDLNGTIETLLKMLQRLIGEDIRLEWRPGAELWPVKMDPSQIDQILANLCVNARDAIADVGTIRIETGTVTFDAAYCAAHPGCVPGDYVMLTVSDDGSGMEAETLDNIFEPFFTTKGVGRGTGLGLATVYGIVKQNEGFIIVHSQPGRGTIFRIYLARHAGQTAPPERSTADAIGQGRGETVLVVEDEPAILKLTCSLLERLGYRVVAARDPNEALNLAGDELGDLRLLVTDVVMPGMNGRELSELLRKHFPHLGVLFMSGYTADVIAHRGVLESGVNFIQKPFTKQDLATGVRAALDGAADRLLVR